MREAQEREGLGFSLLPPFPVNFDDTLEGSHNSGKSTRALQRRSARKFPSAAFTIEWRCAGPRQTDDFAGHLGSAIALWRGFCDHDSTKELLFWWV